MISVLDPRLWLACAGLAAGGFAAGWITHWRGESDRWEARVRAAQDTATRDLLRRTDANMGVIYGYRTKAAQAAAAAASAVRESDRLRDQLAARDQDAGSGPGTDEARALRQLLAACAERYSDVAGEADRLAAKVSGLQGYVAGVCLEPR